MVRFVFFLAIAVGMLLPNPCVAAKIDWNSPYSTVHGKFGIYYEQSGVLFDAEGNSATLVEDGPSSTHPTGNVTLGQMSLTPGSLIDNLLCTGNCIITIGFDCSAATVDRSAVFMDDNATAPSQLTVRPSANNKILDYCTTAGKGVLIDKTDRSFLGLRCKRVGASTYNWVPFGSLGYHQCEL